MTVNDYICKLNDTLTLASKLCTLGEQKPDGTNGDCISCPMRKAEGKSCPVCQMIDIKRALRYAVENNVHGITGETESSDPMVILFIKRAVILGYSVYTLRACDEEYIKLRNLLPVPLTDN